MTKSIVAPFYFLACIASVLGHNCYYSTTMLNASTNFFDGFDFQTFDDPTHGYVDYVDQNTGKNGGLVGYQNNQVYIGVDKTNNVQDWERGRKSIRLSSKRVLNGNNLVIIDLEHMPTTSGLTNKPRGCSLWPAFWTVGPNWPNSGEIDIIEYVNTDSTVATTLHTNGGCDQGSEWTGSFSGQWSWGAVPNDNCDVNAPDQGANVGCNIVGAPNAVGNAFNNNGQRGWIL
jgi:hypothetical protein